MRSRSILFAIGFLPVLALGCSQETSDDGSETGDNAFSSNQATLLDFEFDGQLTTDMSWSDSQTIEDQLLYTIGHLNGDNSVGRLDDVKLTNIQKSTAAGKTTIKYHAKLPVAWGSKTNLPTTYSFSLPRDISSAGQQAFTDKHKETCVDWAAHEVDTGSMWYYYRPSKAGCDIVDAEVVKSAVTITRSTKNTTSKYPEYHKVWEDNRLEAVAIFGKFEETGGAGDAGVSGFNTFVRTMKQTLGQLGAVTSTPANVADSPAPATMDVTLEVTLADGKKVKITALIVNSITNVWDGFQARYESLTTTADVIAYNGHAGLGQNVRALARMGRWSPAKYQIFFMNGCDTFAYVDGSLAQTRAGINPDDPTGTKYMEFVTNAMPSYFTSMPLASTALLKGLLNTAAPMTYDKMFEGIDRAEVVLVTGEEDNVFQPGMPIGTGGGGGGGGGGGATFDPFSEQGHVNRNEEKTFAYDVPAGNYVIDMTGTGDADLYVKKNAAATKTTFDCRPYKGGSAETCAVTFDGPGKLNVMVRGYGPSSDFTVKGRKQD